MLKSAIVKFHIAIVESYELIIIILDFFFHIK